MSKNKDKGSKNKPSLSPEDADLWKSMTKDVELLPGQGYEPASENAIAKKSVRRNVREEMTPLPHIQRKTQGKEIDRATAQKFSRGKMPIDAQIDLHGLGQAEAYEALKRFILNSYRQNKRCVLVITGKGTLTNPGVIKTRLPEWLQDPAIESLILKHARAQIRDGGEGAVYVLLRRQRD